MAVQNNDDIFYVPPSRSLPPFADLSERGTKAFLITSIVICLLGIVVTGLFASGFLMPARSIVAVVAMGVGGGCSLISLGCVAWILVNYCKASFQESSDQQNKEPIPIIEEGSAPEGLFQEDSDTIDVHMNLLNNYLNVQDLGALAQVNAFHAKAVLPAIVSKAQKYGYAGNDGAAAKQYIKDLFGEIHQLQQYKIFNPTFSPEKTLEILQHYNKEQIAELIIDIYGLTVLYSNPTPCQMLMGYFSKLLGDQVIEGEFLISNHGGYYQTQTKMLTFNHTNTINVFLKLGNKDLVELLLVELSGMKNPPIEIAKLIIHRAREHGINLNFVANTFQWAVKHPQLQGILDADS